MANADTAELLDGLQELVSAARSTASEQARSAGTVKTVAFFDLSGSTAAKLAIGVEKASGTALSFTALAASVVDRCSGYLVKSMGDGALAVFDDPVDACRAALNLRYATHEYLEEEMTAGLTLGRPVVIDLGDSKSDFLGDVVDRAARIESLALPGQVLLDGTIQEVVRGHIAGERAWRLDESPRSAHAKGIGAIELYELTIADLWNAKQQLATPLNYIVSGRPSLSEKLALIANARREIIEIGIGLTSFAQYFTGQKPEEFQEPIRQLVRGGVNLNCFALDPEYQVGADWLAEQGNDNYPAEARIARSRIEDESRYCRDNSYKGRVSYKTYRRVPEFWCLGVDVDDPVDGRMFFASYMMGVARSSMPVVQASRTSSPELFDKFMQSVNALRAASS